VHCGTEEERLMMEVKEKEQRRATGLGPAMLLCLAMVLFFAAGVHAGQDASPFSKGSARLSLLFGSNTAFNQDYSVIGIGAGYYVTDGLEAGLDAETWQGNSPRIYRISPELRYVLYSVEPVKPYAGIFYRRTFIEDHGGHNEAGVRAGGIVLAGQRAYFGAGVVYEQRLNCDRSIYSSCSDVYPELMFAVMF
jgi:hypothetical protein